MEKGEMNLSKEKWSMDDLIEVKNEWKELANKVIRKNKKLESKNDKLLKVLTEIAETDEDTPFCRNIVLHARRTLKEIEENE